MSQMLIQQNIPPDYNLTSNYVFIPNSLSLCATWATDYGKL